MTIVTARPIPMAPRSAPNGIQPSTGEQSNVLKKRMNVGNCAMDLSSALISDMPKKRSPNPSTVSPHPRRYFQEMNSITSPRMMAGIVMQAMSNAMICAVIVVPMFAPKMIPIDWVRFRSPAFTNPITITVLALDDWMTAVTSAPARTATNRLLENR